jgi:maleylacetoacetate isomerase/maleylpyruvate isomerase
MRFSGYFRSSAAYRCRIAFNLKGVTPETHFVHLRRGGGEQKSPAYLTVNPQGLVPALEIDGVVLTQSLAIIEWLDEAYPTPALLPNTPVAKAQVRGFSQAIACDIHPLQNLRVLDYLRTEFEQDQKGLDAWCQRWIGEGLDACELLLQRNSPHTRFAFGDEPGLADVCLVPQLFSASRFGLEIARWSRLNAIAENCAALEAFANAHPSRQADAE